MRELGFRTIEWKLSFRQLLQTPDISGLTDEDFARLVRVLIRARFARMIGIVVPMDKLLNEEPI